jgi:pilus assembly protein CpaB
MGARRILVLFLAVVVAGASAMYARSWMESQQSQITAVAAPAPKEEIHEILVATSTIAAGTFVKPHHLRWQRWPTANVPPSWVLRGKRDQEELIGAVVRRGIAGGEPITDGKVVKPGERGFLAAVLTPGMRAVSVPVNPTSSNSGLIFPGDRVDLILTQSLNDGATELTRRVSETVLNDIRVIAMGDDAGDDPQPGRSHEKARTTTLEVTPRQAEQVTLVTELGKLSLSLRSLAQDGDEMPEIAAEEERSPLTWDSDVSRVLGTENKRMNSRLIVLRGSNTENVEVSKGSNQ